MFRDSKDAVLKGESLPDEEHPKPTVLQYIDATGMAVKAEMAGFQTPVHNSLGDMREMEVITWPRDWDTGSRR